MKFSDFFDNESRFRSVDEIKSSIKASKNYKNEPISSAKELNFFRTSKQRSYIISTDKMVYCVVDDIRKNKPIINWSTDKNSIRKTSIHTKDKTEKTGLVTFNNKHKDWLYTKELFNDKRIADAIAEIVETNENITKT